MCSGGETLCSQGWRSVAWCSLPQGCTGRRLSFALLQTEDRPGPRSVALTPSVKRLLVPGLSLTSPFLCLQRDPRLPPCLDTLLDPSAPVQLLGGTSGNAVFGREQLGSGTVTPVVTASPVALSELEARQAYSFLQHPATHDSKEVA